MSEQVSFDESGCDRNPFCPVTRLCPTGAMHIDLVKRTPRLDRSLCTGCGTCVEACPRGAIRAL
jgi:dihydromethanopterin reductase (acceptor)